MDYQDAVHEARALRRKVNRVLSSSHTLRDRFKSAFGPSHPSMELEIRTLNDNEVTEATRLLFDEGYDYTPDRNHYLRVFFPYDTNTRRQPGPFGDASQQLFDLAKQLDQDQLLQVMNIMAQRYLEARQMNNMSGYISDLL